MSRLFIGINTAIKYANAFYPPAFGTPLNKGGWGDRLYKRFA